MSRRSRLLKGALVLSMLLAVGTALAAPPPGGPAGAAAGGEESHDGGHYEWNLYHGMISARDGVEPSLLWRPTGMPPPFFGLLINYGVLFYILYRFGKKPITEALRKRKSTILKGMDDAAKMKKDATERLEELEHKIKHIQDEVERVQREMREAGEQERERILAEAKDRRERMERDAKLLVKQELEAARERLVRDTVRSAMQAAEERLTGKVSATDHQRLADEYLGGIASSFREGRP